MFVPLQGFAPDAEPATQGAILDGSNILPTLRGMRSGPAPVATQLPALAAACRGGHLHFKLDGTSTFYAGAQTALYEDAGTSWTDRSKGGGYTGSATSRWRFASYGDVVIAANYVDATQVSTGAAFSDLAGAPKALIVEPAELFVFAFNTSEATYGTTQYDRWWCCARGDYTSWTPNVNTGAATGRFIDSAGAVLGAKRLGSQVVAYKKHAMYLGTYVGGDTIIDWQRQPGNAGALNHECVALIQDGETPAQVFIGADDIWYFDGSRPISIGAPLREWFFSDLLLSSASLICHAVDEINSRVWWFYPSVGGGGAIDRSVCWNWKSKRWGVGPPMTVEFATSYQATGLIWNNLGTVYSTWADLPNQPWDTAFLPGGSRYPVIFDTTHLLKTLSGVSGASSLTLADIGTDTGSSYLSRVRPRFSRGTPAGTLTHQYRDAMGDAWAAGASSMLASSKFDFGWSARWHRLKMDLTGEWEMSGADITIEQDTPE